MPSGKPINIDKKEFLTIYQKIMSIEKTARYFGYEFSSVRAWMKRNNIPKIQKTKYKCANIFELDTEKSFYWAGFIAADGCIRKHNCSYIIKVALANKDIDHLYKLKNDLCATNPIHKFEDYSELCVVSKKIFDTLHRFAIVPNKSKTLTLPKFIANHKLINHYLRGYIDGDGCFSIYKQKNRNIPQVTFSMRGTEDFLTQAYKVIDRHCGFNIKTRKILMYNNIGSIGYSGNNRISKIYDFLYKDATVYLERKNKIAKQSKYLNKI